MLVKDYAKDVNLSVAEILKKCKELGINATDAEYMLDDDDIIMLDNTINIISANEETTLEEEDEIDEKVDEIISIENIQRDIVNATSKQKLKKKDNIKNNSEFNTLKKQMYKNKSKLKTNSVVEDVILYDEGMTLYELAQKMQVNPAELIKKLIGLGMMITMNDKIDYDTAEILVSDYSKTLKRAETQDVTDFDNYEVIDNENDLVSRPPIVTIMGHVDHGKTSLLDYIRETHVVEGEAGGITQAIGAYQIEYNDKKITFIDTPGHAAFTAMRARGASVTDIAIIIVAADDGVMPQTKEAVDHALNANVPIIVAVNKIDKPDSNPDRVMTEMAEINVTPEAWGGNVPFINISAKTGEGVPLLLDTILAIAEVNDYKANPNRYAVGAVIESKLDKNVGGIASFLIKNGTLRIGDPVVVGTSYAKVRTMKNDLGINILEAGPSTPVEITGLTDNPSAGDKFMAFETEAEAKKVAEKRRLAEEEQKNKKEVVSLDDLFARIQGGQKEINVILKCDVRGSEEAVKQALEKIEVGDVRVRVIRSGIGTITESDVVLANAGNAIIIGFNVVPSHITKEIAKEYSVDIRLYSIIYKLVEDMEAAMKGMLEPEFEEKVIGSAEIRKIFKFSKVGNIAGSYVTDGIVKVGSKVRIIRDGIIIAEDVINSVQREKDSVKEVKKGFECGITLESYNDIKVGDSLELYELVEVKNV
jgi:translation initiation factor IF-2